MFLSTFPTHVRHDEWMYGLQRTSTDGPLLLYKLGPLERTPAHEGELRGNLFEYLMVGKDDGGDYFCAEPNLLGVPVWFLYFSILCTVS